MGNTSMLEHSMELETLVKGLKMDVEEKETTTKTLLEDLREIAKTIGKIERTISKRVEENDDKITDKNRELDGKAREINHLNDSLIVRKEELASLRRILESLETSKGALEKKCDLKIEDVDHLNKKLTDWKKIIDFKSNLEKSYESLQVKYQAKVDELEKVKKDLGDHVEISFQKPSFKEILLHN